jgi:hypothetical protein
MIRWIALFATLVAAPVFAHARLADVFFAVADGRCLDAVVQRVPVNTDGLDKLPAQWEAALEERFGGTDGEIWATSAPNVLLVDLNDPRVCQVIGLDLPEDAIRQAFGDWREGHPELASDLRSLDGSERWGAFFARYLTDGVLQVTVHHHSDLRLTSFLTYVVPQSPAATELLGPRGE